jgi:hypothetical protein
VSHPSQILSSQTITAWRRLDPGAFEHNAKRWKIAGALLLVSYALYAVIALVVDVHTDRSSLLRFFAVSGMACLLAAVTAWRQDRSESKARSAHLLNRFGAVLSSEKKYMLLLRSFDSKLVSEATYKVRAEQRDGIRMIRGELVSTGRTYTDYVRENERVDDVRRFLLDADSGVHTVIIDGREASLSADLLCILSSDADWRKIFDVLKEGAKLIIVVPEDSPSLREEISSLVDTPLIAKCVFLMPPSSRHEAARSGMTRRARWEQSRRNLAVELPEYDENGALLNFKIKEAPCAFPYCHASISNLLANQGDAGAPLGEAFATLYARGLLPHTLDSLHKRFGSVMS